MLLDTLVRPYGETDDARSQTCVKWQRRPDLAVSHAVVGNTAKPGGQWADNPLKASWDIQTLSYARMLSLPGYDIDTYYKDTTGKALTPFTRPTRRQVADYLASYPSKVGIEGRIFDAVQLNGIRRTADGFYIGSHSIHCKHLVLASGTFTKLIYPRPLLQPLLSLQPKHGEYPLLVVGSGFSAADVIISSSPAQKVLHIFKWAPELSPSPLKACHQQAYPEYAGVYKQMKIAAHTSGVSRDVRPKFRKPPSAFDISRDWSSVYEGLPNALIIDVSVESETTATVKLRTSTGDVLERRVSGLAYVVGRRGSLGYLSASLRSEILLTEDHGDLISGLSLREHVHESLELAPDVFCVGSLTGDSLVRFAYGSCVFAAGQIMFSRGSGGCRKPLSTASRPVSSYSVPANGLEGHHHVSAMQAVACSDG